MCLEINLNKTVKLKNKWKKTPQKQIVCWKVLTQENGALYQYFQYKNGWNKSNRVSVGLTEDEEYQKTIYFGFHLFKTRREARSYIKTHYPYMDYKVVKCIGLAKDFVAVGKYSTRQSLVFTKIKVVSFQKQ